MTLAVCLDRSVFHNDGVARMRDSLFARRCDQGGVVVHASPLLIEETIRLFYRNDRRVQVRNDVTFILRISTGRWFRTRKEIFDIECGWMNPAPDYAFMPTWQERLVRRRLRDHLEQILHHDSTNIFADREERRQRDQRLLAGLKGLRAITIAEIRRGQLDSLPLFDEWYSGVRDYALRYNLDNMSHPFRTTDEILAAIETGDRPCAYLDLWTKGVLYMHFRAAANHTERIDLNDHWDLELLLIAKDLDVIVSNDTRFMKSAAEVLFPAKAYLGLDEFLAQDPLSLLRLGQSRP